MIDFQSKINMAVSNDMPVFVISVFCLLSSPDLCVGLTGKAVECGRSFVFEAERFGLSSSKTGKQLRPPPP